MKTFLAIGDENVEVNKGDIIKTRGRAGEQLFAFIEMKRSRWVGKCQSTGKIVSIPEYYTLGVSYALKHTGKVDESVLENDVDFKDLKRNDLIRFNAAKETFMFKSLESKRGGGKYIEAIDIATGRNWKLNLTGTSDDIAKVDLSALKEI